MIRVKKICCTKGIFVENGDFLNKAWKTNCPDHGIRTSCFICDEGNRTTETCEGCKKDALKLAIHYIRLSIRQGHGVFDEL